MEKVMEYSTMGSDMSGEKNKGMDRYLMIYY